MSDTDEADGDEGEAGYSYEEAFAAHECPNGHLTYPGHARCPECGEEQVDSHDLADRTGTVVTWTTSTAAPPGVGAPNHLAIVEFDVDGRGVRAIGQVTTGEIEIGDERKRLVMNLPLREGAMPDQRQDRLIARMIADSDGFLRYLLMLLWEDNEAEIEALGMTRWIFGGGPGRRRGGVETLPLLEELVRAFSRNPERLDDIEDLIRRLRSTDEGKKIVPDEFLELWDAFEGARGEIGE